MRREGSPLPAFRQPYQVLYRLWRGFWRLDGDRMLAIGGMGGVIVGGLPYRSVAEWLRCNGYAPDTDAWDRAEHLLYALDREYVKFRRAELDSSSKPAPPKSDDEGSAGR